MTKEDNQKRIRFSPDGVETVRRICRRVEEKSQHNQKSVDMAKGISDAIDRCGSLSFKQAVWVARGAEFQGLQRPEELKCLCLRTMSWMSNPDDEDVPSSLEPESAKREKVIDQLVSIRVKIDDLIQAVKS